MIQLDAYLTEFIQHNYLSLTLIFAVLKTLAKATPWAVDDDIIQILTGFMGRKK